MADYAALLHAEKKKTSPSSTKIPLLEKKPANPQTVKPVSPQTHLPESGQSGKPANPLDRKTISEAVEKYTTRLTPSMVRRIKIHAAQQDMKDYEVVEKALQEFFDRKT